MKCLFNEKNHRTKSDKQKIMLYKKHNYRVYGAVLCSLMLLVSISLSAQAKLAKGKISIATNCPISKVNADKRTVNTVEFREYSLKNENNVALSIEEVDKVIELKMLQTALPKPAIVFSKRRYAVSSEQTKL